MSSVDRREKASERPNILFLLTDNQGWDMMGCAGNPIIHTPNMDRLASGGVRFVNAFVTTPICAASRASPVGQTSTTAVARIANSRPKNTSSAETSLYARIPTTKPITPWCIAMTAPLASARMQTINCSS